ncbi:MAG: hypothetical protein U1F43_38095, partial [Myxococcota bacterium]
VDGASGERAVVASSDVGSGPALTNAIAMSVDPSGTKAYVLRVYQDEVIEVTLATGARRQILAAQASPRFTDPRHIAWVGAPTAADSADGGTLVVEDDTALVRVDPATGAKAVLAGDGLPDVLPIRGVYGLGGSPLGLLLVDYVPEWETPPQRAPMLFALDPVLGTRVFLAR